MENQNFEKKSLRKIKLDFDGDFKPTENDRENIAKHCVAFANASGGFLIIGIEDGEELPPANQKLTNPDLPNNLKNRISNLTQNVAVIANIKEYSNGGQTIEIKILRNEQSIASTNDGKYYLRVADNSLALLPEDLSQLLNDKPSFIWETKKTKIKKDAIDEDKLHKFLSEIRSSPKVSKFVKDKSDEEVLEHYFFVDEGYLTNLGILWIGLRKDRGNLSYCPTIKFLKYDERGNRVKKITLDEYYLNPKELVEETLKISDWQEGKDIPDGMYRKFIPNYSDTVIRELLVNAIVHRPYTQRGEIVIELHPDYLDIKNPGRFPLGISAQNFLHKNERRNQKLAKVCTDLLLMEAEGTGIDKVYESLLSNGKNLPVVFEGDDFVSIKVERRILNQETISLIERANKDFQLNQRELISLGLIAENNSLYALEFAKKLNLEFSPSTNPTKQWLGSLQDLGMIKSKGKTRGLEYFVNPDFLRKSNFKGKTNLKKIEDHRLRELIFQDIKIYQPTGLGDIHQRIGKELSYNKVRGAIYKMVEKGILHRNGNRNKAKYLLDQNS